MPFYLVIFGVSNPAKKVETRVESGKQPGISVLFAVSLTAFATFWSIKKDTADYSDYIRNGGKQDADRFFGI